MIWARHRGNVISAISLGQVAAGDLEGAWESADAIGATSGSISQASVHWRIAKAWAEMGRIDRASAILKQTGKDEGDADHIKASTVRYKARLGRLEEAVETARAIHDESVRLDSLLDLAKACIRMGEPAQAKRLVRELIQGSESYEDTWDTLTALQGAGEILASLGDSPGALEAFEKATKIVAANGDPPWAIERLASSQARAGFFQWARYTAGPMQEGDEHRYGEALQKIAIAQARAGNLGDAVATASDITEYLQYRDDALLEVVRVHIRRKNVSAALVAAGGIPTPSRKAQAVLEIAAAQARMGDRNGARATANSIDLVGRRIPFKVVKTTEPFDFSSPATWGTQYEFPGYVVGGLIGMVIEAAGHVAAAAMELDQALGGREPLRYAEAFAELEAEILRRIARAQARAGNPQGAVSWARLLANPGQRAYALLGAAEGVMGTVVEDY